MDENSKKPPEKKIEPIISSGAVTRKKPEARKLLDIFLPEGSPSIGAYVTTEIIGPAIKKAVLDGVYAITDSVANGVRGLLYGDAGKTPYSPAGKVSYGSYFTQSSLHTFAPRSQVGAPANLSNSLNTAFSYDDIIFSSKNDAEMVLARMDELISMYGLVSVADLFDLAGKTGPYTNNNYGWADIRSAYVVPVRGGYLLKLPKALPLN